MYDVVLLQRETCKGLTKADIQWILEKVEEKTEVFPIEFAGENSYAMGFITAEAAESLDYDYEVSGLNEFISRILNDSDNESPDNKYSFSNLSIYMAY